MPRHKRHPDEGTEAIGESAGKRGGDLLAI